MPVPVIEIRGIRKIYALDGVEVQALRGIDLRVDEGEFLAIMGPSGSGKSTLMNILGCLDLPDSGEYRLRGRNVSRMHGDELARIRNREIGFIFQNFNLLPRTCALENVETPLMYAGVARRERHRRSREALERMGLGDRLYHLPNQLSGGQQQRVAIARALVTTPSLLLADEPTGNLDSATTTEILELLETLNRTDGLTIILITHEHDIANRTGRRLTLRDGTLEGGS
jgi:putative ABC transport system ATP-binding protein